MGSSSPSFGGWKYIYTVYTLIYLKPPPRNDLQDSIRGCWKWSITEATPKNEYSNWSFRATTSRRVVIPKVYKTRKINSWNLKNHPIKKTENHLPTKPPWLWVQNFEFSKLYKLLCFFTRSPTCWNSRFPPGLGRSFHAWSIFLWCFPKIRILGVCVFSVPTLNLNQPNSAFLVGHVIQKWYEIQVHFDAKQTKISFGCIYGGCRLEFATF